MKPLALSLSLLSSPNYFAQEVDSLKTVCDCPEKRITNAKTDFVGNGYLRQVKCKDRSYFFHTATRGAVQGFYIRPGDTTVVLSSRTRIISAKPYGPKYVTVTDPDNGRSYNCDLVGHRLVYAGTTMQPGESGQPPRPGAHTEE